MSQSGQQAGRYVLLERIGMGGMAEVFRAAAIGVEGFERPVAIKRILPNLAADEDFVKMFVDEAKIAVQLQHPNIVEIFDLAREEDDLFIAMEYVHGKDLRGILDRIQGPDGRSGRIPIEVAVYVTSKICEALHHAHFAQGPSGQPLGIIHRDVSPQNVIVSFDGEVKVTDFGLAKAAGRAVQTQAGVVKGKLAYMSPEQLRGLPLDQRSDVYGVGILLWEMITGMRLFLGKNDQDTLRRVYQGQVPSPRSIRPEIHPDLEAIVLRALAKELDERYESAEQMQDDLTVYLYGVGPAIGTGGVAAFMRALYPHADPAPSPSSHPPAAQPRSARTTNPGSARQAAPRPPEGRAATGEVRRAAPPAPTPTAAPPRPAAARQAPPPPRAGQTGPHAPVGYAPPAPPPSRSMQPQASPPVHAPAQPSRAPAPQHAAPQHAAPPHTPQRGAPQPRVAEPPPRVSAPSHDDFDDPTPRFDIPPSRTPISLDDLEDLVEAPDESRRPGPRGGVEPRATRALRHDPVASVEEGSDLVRAVVGEALSSSSAETRPPTARPRRDRPTNPVGFGRGEGARDGANPYPDEETTNRGFNLRPQPIEGSAPSVARVFGRPKEAPRPGGSGSLSAPRVPAIEDLIQQALAEDDRLRAIAPPAAPRAPAPAPLAPAPAPNVDFDFGDEPTTVGSQREFERAERESSVEPFEPAPLPWDDDATPAHHRRR